MKSCLTESLSLKAQDETKCRICVTNSHLNNDHSGKLNETRVVGCVLQQDVDAAVEIGAGLAKDLSHGTGAQPVKC